MDDSTATDAAAAKAGGRVLAAAQPSRAATLAAADRLKAIGLMCLAVAFFSALDTSAKYLVTQAHLPVVQIVWSRFLGQFLIMLSMLSVLPRHRFPAHAQAQARTAALVSHGVDDGRQLPRPAPSAPRPDHLGRLPGAAHRRAARRTVPRRMGGLAAHGRDLHRLHRRAHRRASGHRRPAPGVPLRLRRRCSPTPSSCC